MTPNEYESRCAEILRTNAHNMTTDEIERLAFGAGEPVTRMLAAQTRELELAAYESADIAIDDAIAFMR